MTALSPARSLVRRLLPRSAKMAAYKLYRAAARYAVAPVFGSTCPVCGRRTVMRRSGTFPPDLAAAWELAPPWTDYFVERESHYCLECGSAERARHFATVIVGELNQRCNVTARSLDELSRMPAVQQLDVAEINSAGAMHPFLAQLPKLRYSEYGSTDPAVPNEDLMALTYADASFDVALTSETLEHVPDVERALSEIRRILRPTGLHLFTIPVVWDRPRTRQRARLENGQLQHLLPPSYHGNTSAQASDYLVFWEFGSDVEERIRRAGFDVRVERHPRNPAMAVFVTRKP